VGNDKVKASGKKGKEAQPKPSGESNWVRRYSLHCFYNDTPMSFEEFKSCKTKEETRGHYERRIKKTFANICIVCNDPTNSDRTTCSDECLSRFREWNCGRSKKFPVTDSEGTKCTLG
jgi:hypothetical protein